MMSSAMKKQGKILCPNANVQTNSREKYARFYITFKCLLIIKSISNVWAFSLWTPIDLYYFTHELFLWHPICQGIWSRSLCNVRKTIFRKNPNHKIYRCILVRSTHHHTLLHNPTILYMKIFILQACPPLNIYRCMSASSTKQQTLLHNTTILHTKIFFAPVSHSRKKISYTSK